MALFFYDVKYSFFCSFVSEFVVLFVSEFVQPKVDVSS